MCELAFFIFFIFIFFLAYDFCRFCVVIRFFIPATTANDLRLRRIFYPRFYPLHLFSYLNSWERAWVGVYFVINWKTKKVLTRTIPSATSCLLWWTVVFVFLKGIVIKTFYKFCTPTVLFGTERNVSRLSLENESRSFLKNKSRNL